MLALFALLTFLVGPAHAVTCDTSWASAVSGDWTDASKWTGGVPDGTKHACITVDGTYTVTMYGSQSIAGLTLGGGANHQTLKVAASDVASEGILTSAGDVTNTATILMTSDRATPDFRRAVISLTSGTLTNQGTIQTVAGSGHGGREIDGNLDNKAGATIQVDHVLTFGKNASTFTNSGAINVASGATLAVEQAADPSTQVFNFNGGAIHNQGTFSMGRTNQGGNSGGSFNASAGTADGNPIELRSVSLNASGTGSATFTMEAAAGAITDDVASGYTLIIRATDASDEGKVTSASGFTNNGTIELTSVRSTPDFRGAWLFVTSGTLLNKGTIHTTAGSGGGRRIIEGNLNNQGTITVDSSLTLDKDATTFTNTGTINVSSGATLAVVLPTAADSTQVFNFNGGAIHNQGTFEMGLDNQGAHPGGTFNATAGTADGFPILLRSVSLNASGTGSATFAMEADAGQITGDVGSGYTLIVRATDASDEGKITSAAGFTNNGTIELTSTKGSPNFRGAWITMTSGTLVNQGTIQTTAGTGQGRRILRGALDNQGTLKADYGLGDLGSGTAITNSGTATIASGLSMTITGSYTQTAGTTTLAAASSTLGASGVSLTGGTLTGPGTISGNLSNGGNVVPNGTLHVTGTYTQAGTGRLAARAGTGGHDELNADGAATLAGTLNVADLGAHPATGTTFQILSGASRSGTFSTVTGSAASSYDVQYDPTHATLVAKEPPPQGSNPDISVGDIAVNEPANGQTATATFTVALSQPSLQPVSVDYSTANGSAAAPGDYSSASGTLNFSPGETQKTVDVTVKGDGTPESDETFFVNLSNASGGQITDDHGTATIHNRDIAITNVVPPTAGAGVVTVTLFGNGFVNGTTAKLSHGGTDVQASSTTVADDGRTIVATFDLGGKPTGAWNVTVHHPLGSEATLANAVTVEREVLGHVWAEFSGPRACRATVPCHGTVLYGNTGNTDATGALLRVSGFPQDSTIDISAMGIPASVEHTDAGNVVEANIAHIPPHGASGAPLTFIAKKEGVTVNLQTDIYEPAVDPSVQPPFDSGIDVTREITARNGPNFSGVYHLTSPQVSGDIPFSMSVKAVSASAPPTIDVQESGDSTTFVFTVTYRKELQPKVLVRRAQPSDWQQATYEIRYRSRQLLDYFKKSKPPQQQDLEQLYHAYTTKITRHHINDCLLHRHDISPQQWKRLNELADGALVVNVIEKVGGKLSSGPNGGDDPTGIVSAQLSVLTQVGNAAWEYRLIGIRGEQEQQTETAGFNDFPTFTGDGFIDRNPSWQNLSNAEQLDAILRLCLPQPPKPKKCNKVNCPGKGGSSAAIAIRAARDPNDKVGPTGGGKRRGIRGDEPLRYSVFFENVASASAPAEQVVVSDPLDTSKLDLGSIELGPISVAARTFVPPPGVSSWDTEVDLRPQRDVLLHIQAARQGNALVWHFTSLDPVTHQPPNDPDRGFLPPDKNPPEGQGSVTYSVRPKANVRNGARIGNPASVVFDANAPIHTPTWVNTIDRKPPTSRIAGTKRTGKGCKTRLLVKWRGSDNISGVRSFAVLAGVGKGRMTVWHPAATKRSGLYPALPGKTYRFATIATDGAGNIQRRGSKAVSVKVTGAACKR